MCDNDTNSAALVEDCRMARSQHAVFGYPVDFVRFSWSTARVALKSQGAARVEWPCDEEESQGADIATFFPQSAPCSTGSEKPSAITKRRRTEFYHARKMKHVTMRQLFE